MAIKSFADRDTEALADRTGKLAQRPWAGVALRKLRMIANARDIHDLRSPPGNRLERLKADRVGQWSIRINQQWRICFTFDDGDARDVEIVDYH